MDYIKIEDISKRYGKITALGGISLAVNKGELIVILGPSGCGKTTLLRILAGLETPDKGEIFLDKKVVTTSQRIVPPEKRDVGMVFQDLALWPHMTVSENIEFGLKVKIRSKSERGNKIQEILRLLNMERYKDFYPSKLSGGERQRVAIARTLALEPKVLLLDEPLANIDARLKEELLYEIYRLKDHLGITSIYVTHDQEEAMSVADRIAVMNFGYIEQVGSPEEIYRSPGSEFVARFVGNGNVIKGTVKRPDLVDTEVGQIRCDTKNHTGQVTLVIRAEDFAVSQNGNIKGKVMQKVFKMDRLIYHILINNYLLRIQCKDRLLKGEKVNLDINSEPIILPSR